MGANQQTSVPAFTSGQVLTAQQQTEINTGVPVFADTTARDAAFGGTGEKVLAEGQMAYVENLDVVQYYDGSVWATVGPAAPGGLAFVNSTTFTTVTSVSLPNDSFDAGTGNYRVVFNLTAITSQANLTGRFRAAGVDDSSARYFQMSTGLDHNGSASNQANSAATAFTLGVSGTSSFPLFSMSFDVYEPARASLTHPAAGSIVFFNGSVYVGRHFAGQLDTVGAAFAVDSFTWISSVASSMTGRVTCYRYVNS